MRKSATQDVKNMIGGLGSGKPIMIEERTIDAFFSRITNIRDWYTPKQIANAKGFVRLRKLLEENLTDVQVLRSGRIQIDIYVVGTDEDGNVVGIRMKAVET